MGEYLVVFAECVLVAKERFEEFHGLDGDLEHEWGQFFHMFVQRFDAVQGHRDILYMRKKVPYKYAAV